MRLRLRAEKPGKTMQSSKVKWLLPIACCLVSGRAPAWQGTDSATKRLYVETFETTEFEL
jgi:hypothetical protein